MRFFLLALFLIGNLCSNAQTGDEAVRIFPPSTYKAGPSIYHFAKDERGYLYIASNKGVIEYNGSSWNLIPLSNYSDAGILTGAEDGKIYVGATNDFGYLDKDSTGTMRYYSLISLLEPNLRNTGDIWQVVQYNDQIIFQSYQGLFFWDGGDKITYQPIDEIYIFVIDGTLYATQFETGLFGPLEGGQINSIEGAPEVLKKDLVFSVFPYGPDRHLLATSGNGLFILDPETSKIQALESEASRYLTEFGFFDGTKINDSIYSLGTWEKGLIFINQQGDILKYLDKSNVLLANKIHHAIKGNRNDLWVGTDNGIVYLSLDSLGFSASDQHPVPEEVVIGQIMSDQGLVKGEHQLNAPMGNFDVRPTSMIFNFSIPAWSGLDVEFSYLLEGFDDKWSDWTSDPYKEYTNLSGGTYAFKVKARQSLTQLESSISSVDLSLPFKWYETIWGYSVIIISFIGLIYGSLSYRTYRLKKANRNLSRMIDRNTSNLRKQKKELKELNQNLTVANQELDSFVYHTSHDLKAPLKSIVGLTNLAKRETTDENVLLYFSMIEGSVLKLEEFITSIIDYSANSKSKLNVSAISFKDLIHDTRNSLLHFENAEKIRLQSDIQMETEFYSDAKRLQIILNNLISNAIKYHNTDQEDPFVSIDVTQSNGRVHINVSDNGPGISEAHHEKIFDMFYRASEMSFGSGLGLYIVKETVSKLNGSIVLDSESGKGTSFRMEIPNLVKS